MKLEAVVRHAAVGVEPKVQRIVRGHDAPVRVGQIVAAESADHLTAGVSAVVYL